jgi:SecD/SecF fusion protein
MTDRQRNWFILLLVAGLLAASGVVIATYKTVLGLDLKGGVELVYQAEATPQTPRITQDALQRAVDVMNERVNQLGVSEPSIQVSGGKYIDVQLPAVHDVARAEKLVGTTAQLLFYDWEANALLPNGKTVASQLPIQDPGALAVSRGTGLPGAGSMPLYTAVKLASQQPSQPNNPSQSRRGPAYYMFGAPGSAACAAAAKFYNVVNQLGQRCFLAGPDATVQDLVAGLPTGVSA